MGKFLFLKLRSGEFFYFCAFFATLGLVDVEDEHGHFVSEIKESGDSDSWHANRATSPTMTLLEETTIVPQTKTLKV